MENQLTWYNKTIRQYFSNDELKQLVEKSDWQGFWQILYTWLWIGFAFAIVGLYPNVFIVIIALFIIGGKQLACAIIMHDCSHDSLFKTSKLNTFFGNWFGAYPILQNLEQYKPYHREHHIYTGLDNDPDLSLTKGYPTTILSMLRKFFRDLSGVTGLKGQIGVIAMHIGILQYNLGGIIKRQQLKFSKQSVLTALKNLAGPVSANLLIFAFLFIIGKPMLYLLWIGALLTTYNFCLRVRSIAEHSVVENRQDPSKNTRTTYANIIEQVLFAPLNVNYHAEHHLFMGVPCYNLPYMHQKLIERGYYSIGVIEQNYWSVIKKAMSLSK